MAYDYEKFKSAVLSLTKIDLSSYKERQMKRRIDALITKHGIKGYEEYVQVLRSDKSKFEEFVNYLTINVSEFYRNPDQWRVMDKEIIPELINKFGTNLKIWSAACSTGDEPYSLVMALPSPLIADVVTARVGHIPSISTKVGFSFTSPLISRSHILFCFIAAS